MGALDEALQTAPPNIQRADEFGQPEFANVTPGPVNTSPPDITINNFEEPDEAGQQVQSAQQAQPVDTLPVVVPVGEDDFFNPGGGGGAAPGGLIGADPLPDQTLGRGPTSLVDTLSGLPTGPQILAASGLLAPIGGQGGGAQRGFVSATGEQLSAAQQSVQETRQARDDAVMQMQIDKLLQADSLAQAEEENANLLGDRARELETRQKNAQEIYAVTIADREQAMTEAAAARKRYTDIQLQPDTTMGQRGLSALAIAFSAFGSEVQRSQIQAVTGQRQANLPNLALQVLKQQEDNEFRRQQLELQKAGKEIQFADNAVAQSSALLRDQIDMETNARMSIVAVFKAKSEAILASAKGDDIRAQAGVAVQVFDIRLKELDLKWNQENQTRAQAASNRALEADGNAKAQAARARSSARERQNERLANTLFAQRQLQLDATKEDNDARRKFLSDVRSLEGKGRIPAGKLAESTKAVNTMLLHLETLDSDPELSGIGVGASQIGELATSALGALGADEHRNLVNANRKAANELARAYRLMTTGQQSTDKELERIMRDQGMMRGQPVDVFRRAIEDRRSEMGDVIIRNFTLNPESIQVSRTSGLKLALSIGRLPESVKRRVQAQLAHNVANNIK